jgi:hypothetical protein
MCSSPTVQSNAGDAIEEADKFSVLSQQALLGRVEETSMEPETRAPSSPLPVEVTAAAGGAVPGPGLPLKVLRKLQRAVANLGPTYNVCVEVFVDGKMVAGSTPTAESGQTGAPVATLLQVLGFAAPSPPSTSSPPC